MSAHNTPGAGASEPRQVAESVADRGDGRHGGTYVPWLRKWVCRECFGLNNDADWKACPGYLHHVHNDGSEDG